MENEERDNSKEKHLLVMQNKLSVIIPVYNAEKYLKRAINSVLYFKCVEEVILIEDNSPDNSIEICNQFKKIDSRVKVIQHPDKKNHGAGLSRNLGIKKAKSKWIAFLDADDFYLPNRFDFEKKYLFNSEMDGMHGALGVDYSDDYEGNRIDRLDGVKNNVPPENLFNYLIGYNFDENKLGNLRFRGHIHLNCLTLKREMLLKEKIVFPEIRLHQDTVFIYKCAYYMRLINGNINSAIAIRGIHQENRIFALKQSLQIANKRIAFYNELINWGNQESLQNHYLDLFSAERLEFIALKNKSITCLPIILVSFLKSRQFRKQRKWWRSIKYSLGYDPYK